MISPEARLGAVLFGSFILWLPALDAMIAGDLEPSAAGVRYGVAVVFVWVAFRSMERLLAGYAAPPTAAEGGTAEPERATDGDRSEAGASPVGGRRADDGDAVTGTRAEAPASR